MFGYVRWIALGLCLGISAFCAYAGQEVQIDGKTLSHMPSPTSALDAQNAERASEMVNRGLAFLASKREADGGWSLDGTFKPAVTALVLKALVQHPDLTTETPIVKKGYELLLSFQQPDGAIYDPRQGRSNYCTAIAACALAAANDPTFKPAMDKAVAYLRTIQIHPGSESPDGQAVGRDHPFVGGVSYGEHGRPDMSNLGWWMEAMREAGVPANDPDVQQALSFVLRCQNRSESNSMAWAAEGPNDGGFIYAPAVRDVTTGETKAGSGPGGKGLASYGSISYVAWKSMLYTGLSRDDPRVKAVYAWGRRNWTLKQNPNMPEPQAQQGVYFYYLALARALRAWGQDEIPAWDGPSKHNWRRELVDELAQRVQKDGSFYNVKESRWGEGNPVLTTAYEVQALEEALKK
jgi:squalene-hopene/tetraprenyl-beta-curcumene cyclase